MWECKKKYWRNNIGFGHYVFQRKVMIIAVRTGLVIIRSSRLSANNYQVTLEGDCTIRQYTLKLLFRSV